MKKIEREQLEADIGSNLLIAGQGIWECLAKLNYKIEQSVCLSNAEMKELVRKLTIVKQSIEQADKSVHSYFSK